MLIKVLGADILTLFTILGEKVLFFFGGGGNGEGSISFHLFTNWH